MPDKQIRLLVEFEKAVEEEIRGVFPAEGQLVAVEVEGREFAEPGGFYLELAK